MKQKKIYVTPIVKVVEFKVEHGFVSSSNLNWEVENVRLQFEENTQNESVRICEDAYNDWF